MGFLDNLESNLNSLEKGSEREDAGRERHQKQSDRARQQAIAPWAAQLKSAPYTSALMSTATREGFRARMKVYIAWMGDTLRLDAREKRLELRPTADGIQAVFLEDGKELRSVAVDLNSDPVQLVGDWLG